MTPPRPSRVAVLLGGAATLPRLDRSLARHGIRLRRIDVLEFPSVARGALERARDRFGPPDALLVGSPRAIDAFVRPLLDARRHRSAEVWAAGATTAGRLRRLGWRRVRSARPEGVDAAIAALGAGAGRSLLYPRSDRAGPGAGVRLRQRGWTVWDPIVYRTAPRTEMSPRDRIALGKASFLIATSPSALSAARRILGRRGFRALRRRASVVALGARTLRAARGHGFRGAASAPAATVQALTYYAVRRFADASPSLDRTVSIPPAARAGRGA